MVIHRIRRKGSDERGMGAVENGPSPLRSQVVQASKQLIEGKGMSERAMSVVRKNQVLWKVLTLLANWRKMEGTRGWRNKRVERELSPLRTCLRLAIHAIHQNRGKGDDEREMGAAGKGLSPPRVDGPLKLEEGKLKKRSNKGKESGEKRSGPSRIR